MATTVDKSKEKFSVFLQAPQLAKVPVTLEQQEQFSVYFQPSTEFTPGDYSVDYFPVYVWTPILLEYVKQYYHKIFHAKWDKYIETAFAEFGRYELHRSATPGFTPVPADPTLVFQTTDDDVLEYWDTAPDEVTEYYYRVIVVLDDGRYAVSPEISADHYPVWTVPEPPPNLIHNNGDDQVPMDTQYDVESTVATNPEGPPVFYQFQICKTFNAPSAVWNFTFSDNPLPRFIDCVDRNVVIDTPSAWGVRVNAVLWADVWDGVSYETTLSGYGPTDEVYCYDPKKNFIVFGDGTNGKLPANPDAISVNYSVWVDISTATAKTNQIQVWDVGTPPASTDYRMRVFPFDDLTNGIRGFASISYQEFAIVLPIPPPTLVLPDNLDVVATYFPTFKFYGKSLAGGNLKYRFQVASDPDFSTIIEDFNQISTPSEWLETEYLDGAMVTFVPGETRPIINLPPFLKKGPYYWRAALYDVDFATWSSWSPVWSFNIVGATFKWKIGLIGAEKKFLPAKQGWNVETVQIGREGTQRKVFRCSFAFMGVDQRDIMKAEFDRRTILSLWDNEGNNYFVYWGECDRALSGKAFPPDNPIFGIDMKNYIPGAVRYAGDSIFTEI